MALRLTVAGFLLACLATLAPAFAPAPVYKEPARPRKSDLEQLLQGRWELGSQVMAKGRAMGFRLHVEGKTWTYRRTIGEVEREGPKYHLVLDAKRSPATLDLVREGTDRVMMKGIVKVEGDTLTFCYVRGTLAEAMRPTSFDPVVAAGAPKSSRTYRMIFKRAKKGRVAD